MFYSTHLLRHMRFIIGRNIHCCRAKQKMPLQRLAQLSGVTERFLDYYEQGKSEIALDELLKIACALDLKVEELFVTKPVTTCIGLTIS